MSGVPRFDPQTGQPIEQPPSEPAQPPAPAGGGSGGMRCSGCAPGEFDKGALREPKVVLRIATFFTSMIAFSCVAGVTATSTADYYRVYGFKWDSYLYMEAANILVWLWSMYRIADALVGLEKKLPLQVNCVPITFAIDLLLVFLVFVAFCAATAELNAALCFPAGQLANSFGNAGGGITYCSDIADFCATIEKNPSIQGHTCPAGGLNAAVAFTFFTLLMVGGSAIVSFKDWQGGRGESLPALGASLSGSKPSGGDSNSDASAVNAI